MPAIWTPPRTWVDGETPTGVQFNTHFRDNLLYLKEVPAVTGITTTGDATIGRDLGVARNLSVGNALTVVGQTVLQGPTFLGDSAADGITVQGTVFGASLQTYTETRSSPVISGDTLTLDCLAGTYFKVALTANITITITNVPATSRALGLTIIFVADGTQRAITWPTGTVWPSGIAPTMTYTTGKRDLVTLLTEDGGVTWFGILVGQLY